MKRSKATGGLHLNSKTADQEIVKGGDEADLDTTSRDEDYREPDTVSSESLAHDSSVGKGKEPEDRSESTKSAKVFWPHDLLSDACPKARVSVFGYESKTLRYGSITQSNIDNISSDFLQELRHERASGVPLIFIGHSLGGIIIKEVGQTSLTSQLILPLTLFKALLQSDRSDDRKLRASLKRRR
jgi:hypothetical protein